jgi:hypothetical protein
MQAMTIDQDITARIIHDGLVACGQSSDPDDEPPPPIIDDYDVDPIDEGDPIEEPRDDEFARVDPDDGAPDPWPPEAPCRNCAGPHHIQVCPEILAALRAPYPNGAEIARAFHRNCRGWAREEMQKGFPVVYNDARLYADYMAERMPNQEPMTVLRVIRIWDRAAALTSAHQG